MRLYQRNTLKKPFGAPRREPQPSKPPHAARDVGPLGIPIEIGTPSVGGPFTTRCGLTFIAAAQDIICARSNRVTASRSSDVDRRPVEMRLLDRLFDSIYLL